MITVETLSAEEIKKRRVEQERFRFYDLIFDTTREFFSEPSAPQGYEVWGRQFARNMFTVHQKEKDVAFVVTSDTCNLGNIYLRVTHPDYFYVAKGLAKKLEGKNPHMHIRIKLDYEEHSTPLPIQTPVLA